MKGSRYAAVGLVAVAALWIFSGHLGPHGKGESVAANRPAEAPAAPLFRVSVMTAEVAPHVRQLYLSGRTEAEHKVMITSRTNGLLDKLNVKRGQAVKEGEVVAVLSDEAREAQVEQATCAGQPAQGRARSAPQADRAGHLAAARRRQPGIAVPHGGRGAGRGRGRARPRRDPRAVGRHHHRCAGRRRPADVAGQGDRATGLARSDARHRRGLRAQARRRQGRRRGEDQAGRRPDRARARALRVEVGAAPPRAPTASRSRSTTPTARSPTASPARCMLSLAPVAGGARAALVADVLVGRRTRRARRQRRRTWSRSCRCRCWPTARRRCGSTASPAVAR